MATIEDIRILHDGWGRFCLLTISDGGQSYERQIEDHGDAASVLPYDPERGMVTLVRQLRTGPLFKDEPPWLLEAPAGIIENEMPEEAARREALEEVGLVLRSLEPLGAFWASPGISTEVMSLFLAAYSQEDRATPGGGAAGENEDIEVVELPIDEAIAMTTEGKIRDMKTFALLQALQLRMGGWPS